MRLPLEEHLPAGTEAVEISDTNSGRLRLERPLISLAAINWELVLFAGVILLAFVTRFYLLEPRVMSHDENSHVYYSWRLYQGMGYTHDPVTHGPFQFHVLALSYFLFGASDTTARIPAVLFSIATVAFLWAYRRYLGRFGALAAALLMTISPYMLYYGRYVRNEAFVALWGVVMLWAMLHYLERGQSRSLYILAAVTSLHFATKETAFIYQAQAMIFAGLLFLWRLWPRDWQSPTNRRNFWVALPLSLVSLGAGAFLATRGEKAADAAADAGAVAASSLASMSPVALVLFALGAVALLAALYFLVRGYTWKRLRQERAFGLLVILGTLVLPMLAPFPVKLAGLNPIDYSSSQTITVTAVVVVLLSLLAVGVGLAWRPRVWLISAGIFYGIFLIFYTTVFTNGFGFFTGLVGSLGYWLEQQGVNRGSQPFYYYALLQVPVYEFLPAIGALIAGIVVLIKRSANLHPLPVPAQTAEAQPAGDEPAEIEDGQEAADQISQPPTFALLAFWSLTSLLAYSVAGEKMPWLTVHITLPLILLSGWSIGYLLERMDWANIIPWRGWLAFLLLPVFILSLLAMTGMTIISPAPPTTGIQGASNFAVSLISAIASGLGIIFLVGDWPFHRIAKFLLLAGLAFLAVLTARAAFRASYINYDNPTEFLVYAHSASGNKIVLSQLTELSMRIKGDLSLPIAHDNETRYPFWWYLRDFTNVHDFGENPTRNLREYPVILVGDDNYAKIEPIVGDLYERFDYLRIWWPNQDYWKLKRDAIEAERAAATPIEQQPLPPMTTLEYLGRVWGHVKPFFTDPRVREADWQIWINRDYTRYGELTGQNMNLSQWQPAQGLRLYIRKDIVSQIWNYGSQAAAPLAAIDPYEGKGVVLSANQILGGPGQEPGTFNKPRGVAAAADGSLYVADSGNHRIQHLAADGSVLQVWGQFGDASQGQAPGGVFSEPWGVAVGPDGSVYVADTWNHRIQKFTAEGQFVMMWGHFGQGETPDAFYGPRSIAVDSLGRLFVADTGNSRVVVFDSEGKYISQFGAVGAAIGQFSEPVGVAVDDEGQVYVADTWNQRVQVIGEMEGGAFQSLQAWDISGWYGQSLENKPYLAVDPSSRVLVSDPEGYRVLVFDTDGNFLFYWGDFGSDPSTFDVVNGLAVDSQGGVWLADAGNNRIMHFVLPNP